MRPGRAVGLLAAGVLVLVACSDADRGTDRSTDGSVPGGRAVALEPVEESPREDVPSALEEPAGDGLPAPLVDVSRILDGGPPPDGIPAIDAPLFERAADVTWLEDDEAVLALTVDGEARAYPVQILIWHEIVNDTVAGAPVSVTYCPLCNSALGYDRRVGERLVTFGTSGSLYLSALVMYDRQTQSLWSQIEGRAIAGVLAGTELTRVPVATVPWGVWLKANPHGWVLSRQTGFSRDYGANPYVGYDRAGSEPFLLDVDSDPRLPPKERVIAFPGSDDPVAVRLAVLEADGVLTVTVDDEPVVLLAEAGLASALDKADVAGGAAIASTGAFSPVVDGRTLTFRTAPSGGGAVDVETGSRWDVLGRATSGPLVGTALSRVPHVDTFWFAWAAFRPDAYLAAP